MAKNKKTVTVTDIDGESITYLSGRSFTVTEHGALEVYSKGFNLIAVHKTWASARVVK